MLHRTLPKTALLPRDRCQIASDRRHDVVVQLTKADMNSTSTHIPGQATELNAFLVAHRNSVREKNEVVSRRRSTRNREEECVARK